jgi:hypothetical protein|tara:strand:+ start:44 stop:655 length:612 start_codon:yes stop_codon:yes gene_type:complete
MAVISNGTTLLDAGALSVASGSMTLIKTLTASSSATLSFVHGASDVVFDGTYKEYVFKFMDIHPAADGPDYTFNVSIDSGSNYNVTKTSTQFNARQSEGDSTGFSYISGNDLAQGTGFQIIGDGVGGGVADECLVGTLQIFDVASTTKVKHYTSIVNNYRTNDDTYNVFTGGYANTTSAVNAIQFKFSSGNTDSGIIKMYGIS